MRALIRRTALFDHDGTVVNSLDLVVAATNATIIENGHQACPDQLIIDGMVMPTGQRIGHLLGVSDLAQQAVLADGFYAHAQRLAPRYTRLYPGVRAVCHQLARDGWVLGMVTNNQGHLAAAILKAWGLGPLFSLILGEEDVPVVKPHPSGLRQAMRVCGVRAREAIYIGDSSADAGAARAAGMPAVGVTWGTHTGVELSHLGFDRLCRTSAELLATLRAWARPVQIR